MHVLITGGNGFTGKYVTSELERKGYRISSIVRSKPKYKSEYFCDITEKKSVYELIHRLTPDYIIHLAATSFVGHPDQFAFYKNNLFGTENLLSAASKIKNLKKIVVASSASVYGNQGSMAISEQIAPRPPNHYALSKYAMEGLCYSYFDKLPIIITRPFNYTGPGQGSSFVVPKIVEHFKQKRDILELGNLDVCRDFSDVADISDYYVSILESGLNNEIINLCSGNIISLNDIVNELVRITGHSIDIKINKGLVRENDIPFLLGDRTKLAELMGNKPMVKISKTLERMIF